MERVPLKRLPLPRIELVDVAPGKRSIRVVRDDILPGGTKQRYLYALFDAFPKTKGWVYASPTNGHAQVAMAIVAKAFGVQAVIFIPKRSVWSEYTKKAYAHGAVIHQVEMGFLKTCQAKAKAFVDQNPGYRLMPFGCNHPVVVDSLANFARSLMPMDPPKEVWSALSSGTVSRGLQKAWPKAKFYGVMVGHEPTEEERGRAFVYKAPEKFDQKAKMPPPFPSCPTFDAKVWQFIVEHASDDALFWNVSA